MKKVKVAVTGAAGQIAYSLLFRLAAGEVFGPEVQVDLSLLEIPQARSALDGITMELEDCNYKTLGSVTSNTDAKKAFSGANWVLMIGAMPRGPGMERSDLIRSNGPIFVEQGKALANADTNVRVVVVGNPCNTNALIAACNAPDIPKERFSAMMALDENRAVAQISQKANCSVQHIRNLIVWGNHSPSMYPDFENIIIGSQKATEAITDKNWFTKEFIPQVQQRGSAIIKARGKSSAASAASACMDHIKRLLNKSSFGNCHSIAVWNSDGAYNIPKGIFFSFPIVSKGDSEYEIFPEITLSTYATEKLQFSAQELLKERELIKDLLPS